MNTTNTNDIRGVLIQIAGSQLLLPNAATVEVLSYADPEPIAHAPDWLLGQIRWRGWRLPLVSLPILTGRLADESRMNARVAVLKALGGNSGMPFIALLVQGFPRLTTITPDLLIPTGDESAHATGVHAQVLVRDDQAVIPNMGQIEALVAQAIVA